MLSVSDATKLPVIYHRYADKAQFYITGSFGKTESVFNMQDWKAHAHFRKLAASPYSFTNIKKMEPLVDEQMRSWFASLDKRFANTGEFFDIAPRMVHMAYDVVSELGFGAPIGFIEADDDVEGLIKGFHEGLTPFGLLARVYPFTNWVKKTSFGDKYLVARPEQNWGVGILMRFRDKLLAQRRSDIEAGTTKGRVDLLQT